MPPHFVLIVHYLSTSGQTVCQIHFNKRNTVLNSSTFRQYKTFPNRIPCYFSFPEDETKRKLWRCVMQSIKYIYNPATICSLRNNTRLLLLTQLIFVNSVLLTVYKWSNFEFLIPHLIAKFLYLYTNNESYFSWSSELTGYLLPFCFWLAFVFMWITHRTRSQQRPQKKTNKNEQK
jgi:hypothetical protein